MSLAVGKRQFIICISVASILLVGLEIKQDDPLAPVRASKTYTSGDFGTMGSIDVCNGTPESIGCWDADGSPDPILTSKMMRFYTDYPQNHLYFRYGRKARIIILGDPSTASDRTGPYHVKVADGPRINGENLEYIGPYAKGNEGEPYQRIPEAQLFAAREAKRRSYAGWYAAFTDPKLKAVDLEFDLRVSFGAATIPLREGAEGQIGPLHIRIGRIKRIHGRLWGSGHPFGKERQPTWSVPLSISGFSGAKLPRITVKPVNDGGFVIGGVDSTGRPSPPGRMFTAWCEAISGEGTANQEIGLCANPAFVPSLFISAQGTRKVTLTDIPIEPQVK